MQGVGSTSHSLALPTRKNATRSPAAEVGALFFIDNLLVRNHFIIEYLFPGSLTSTFLQVSERQSHLEMAQDPTEDLAMAKPRVYTLHPAPYTLHPIPHTLHPIPYILHPTPYTLHPTPYTLHSKLQTLNPPP